MKEEFKIVFAKMIIIIMCIGFPIAIYNDKIGTSFVIGAGVMSILYGYYFKLDKLRKLNMQEGTNVKNVVTKNGMVKPHGMYQ